MKTITETIFLLQTQCDDMTGQEISYLLSRLLDEGALDALAIPALMKKGRPGFLIQVLCKKEKKEKLFRLLFEETPTLGVREEKINRRILPRRSVFLKTSFGSLRAKEHFRNGKKEIVSEFDELAEMARRRKMPLRFLRQKYGLART